MLSMITYALLFWVHCKTCNTVLIKYFSSQKQAHAFSKEKRTKTKLLILFKLSIAAFMYGMIGDDIRWAFSQLSNTEKVGRCYIQG